MNAIPPPMFRLLLLLVALSFAACTDPRRISISRLRDADAAELRTEVARLYTRMFHGSGYTLIPVRPELWPAPILKLRPRRLNLYRDGLAVTLQSEPGYEYGIHILPAGDAEAPKPSARTQYEKLEPGIFYFTQKR